jgi:hydrogenase maturation protein HypF
VKLTAPLRAICRVRVRVRGTVQGVGFRPYVYRLASELGLSGFVFNDAHGVLLEVEGSADAIEAFLTRLEPDAPPLAVLESVSGEARAPTGADGFAIRHSPQGGVADAPVTPDSATCSACLAELCDPGDRRYRYPFINCTNCGPRFTIVRGVPYDRPLTTMSGFVMCPSCRAEYDDPTDRRFHAQPNACPECGPSVRLLGADGLALPGPWAPDPVGTSVRTDPVGTSAGTDPVGTSAGTDRVSESAGTDPFGPRASPDPIGAAAAALRDGAIVAIKGIGGYHLACRADDERAVARLRARKHREDKPFALIAASIEAAERYVSLGQQEHGLMSGPERPIVLAPRRLGAPVADAVAPGAPELGVMLPYSPLHHLLLADVGTALVLTSGNVSDEPIAYRDEHARERLRDIADLFLVHDRPIQTRTDDSVVRGLTVAGSRRSVFLRRSRGFVPGSLPLPDGGAERPLLACGAELKNTFCVAKGARAWVSHHIGDLENYETLCSFTEGIEHFERLFAVTPEVVAHDLHPEYLSTKYALDRAGVQLVGVQHHHAHLAACLAEHGVTGPAVGAIFDGTGYGSDGTVWGGEILYGDLAEFRRAGTLLPVRLPGGAQAIRQPWRMACAWLSAAGQGRPDLPQQLAGRVDPVAWRQVGQLVQTGLRSPITSSIGRLFDAAAALCGLRATVNYEGQAAIELEAACDPREHGAYPISLDPTPDPSALHPDERHPHPDSQRPARDPTGHPTALQPDERDPHPDAQRPACDPTARPNALADGNSRGGGHGDNSATRGGRESGPGGEERLLVIDPRQTIQALVSDISQGTTVGVMAARFHTALALVTVEACTRAAASHGTEIVVLSGGVFQNRRLLEAVSAGLHRAGLRVLVPERLPANDGGISYGQAAVAARRIAGV